MDDLITTYIDTHYTDAQASLVYRSLGLCNCFNYPSVYEDIQTLVMEEQNIHQENIRDGIFSAVEDALDKIIFANRITFSDTPPLAFKVDLLEGLYGISFRESYNHYVGILEDWTSSAEQKLSKILADITSTPESEYLEYIEWVYEGAFQRLYDMIMSRVSEEQAVEDVEMLKEIRKNLLIFNIAFGLPSALNILIQNSFAKGAAFDTYMDLFDSVVVDLNNLEDTAWRMIYLAMVSSDGYMNPQKLLNEKSSSLFPDLVTANKFTSMVQKAMGRYQEFKEHAQ